MPYESAAQAAKVHILARQGVPWAVKFQRENAGTHVQGHAPKARHRHHRKRKVKTPNRSYLLKR